MHTTDAGWRRGLELGEAGLGHFGRGEEASGSQVLIFLPCCGKQPDPNHIHQSEAFQALVPVLWFYDSIIYD